MGREDGKEDGGGREGREGGWDGIDWEVTLSGEQVGDMGDRKGTGE